MLTPRFSLSQDEKFLTINIQAPHCALRLLETYVQDNDFRFVCTPYYLRLNLPGNILDNDEAIGKFYSEKGEFMFKYPKENKNEYFEGLDFITSLLVPKTKKTQPEIEVIKTEDNENTDDSNEWFVNQELPEETITEGFKYGFANQKSGSLKNTEDEFYSVFDVRNVESTSLSDRNLQKHDMESMQFSEDHYLGDYFDDENIVQIIKNPLPWKPELSIFSPSEIDLLKDFPNREYVLNDTEKRWVLLGLLDVLFAYCYDQRTTEFEGNCESGWTVTKISGTLSWFVVYENEKDVIVSAMRRSLIYPLYRNYKLSETVFNDLKHLLSLGPIFIVKCLINVFRNFHLSAEPGYILNDLYIKDYIIYMQKYDKPLFDQMVKNVTELVITEKDLDLNYDRLQCIIKNGGRVEDKLACLRIADSSDSDDSESDSSTDSDYTSDSDSDDSD